MKYKYKHAMENYIYDDSDEDLKLIKVSSA